MTPRKLWRVSVAASPDAEDAVQEALSRVTGKPATIYTDADSGRTNVFVYLPGPSGLSKTMRARLVVALSQIRASGLDCGSLAMRVQRIRPENWAESWKRHFKPVEIGTSLLLKPSWSRQAPKRNQAVVILDPGLSFGTGQHPTTRFCLEQLVRASNASGPRSFLDIGTGSGILAIAAAKLGYAPIEAFDCDPDSVRVAAANARQNGVRRRVHLRRLDVKQLRQLGGGRFDLVCANLTADVLLDERHRILATLDEGGRLVLAGILHSQFPTIQLAYEEAGLRLGARHHDGEWESGVFVRQAAR